MDRLRLLTQILKVQSRAHRIALTAADRDTLLDEVCRAIAGCDAFHLAWCGWKAEGFVVEPIAIAGRGLDDPARLRVRWDDSDLGRGPVGTAIRTGELVVRHAVAGDPGLLPWRRKMARRGLDAGAAVPLRLRGEVVGALCLYVSGATRLDDATVDAIGELGGIVELGLERLAAAAERQHAVDALSRLATAVEQAAEAVLVTDANGMIEYVNPAFSEITGYRADEVAGQTPRLLKSGAQPPEFYVELWRRLQRGESFQGQLVNRRKDGSSYAADVVISPVVDASRRIRNFVGLQRDVTRERELDLQVRQLQKVEALGQLTGGIAHDFNNLLGIVLTNAAFLRDDLRASLDPEQDRALGDLEEAARAGATLVRKLLSLGRRDTVEVAAFDVTEALERVSGMLRRVIPASVEVVLAGAPGVHARGDPGSFDQIVVNLATNARDAMPRGGTLRLSVELTPPPPDDVGGMPSLVPAGEDACVRVRVEDTGTGIAPEVLAHVFEPFFTTKPAGHGTGLGLPMVVTLVRQQGGVLRVASTPGVGTTFDLYLRRARCGEQRRATTRPDQAVDGRETVLVVEDEPRMRRATARTLERLGYTVLTAADGVEALEVWETARAAVSAVVTDLAMPRLGGVDLAYALRGRGATVPIVMVSGAGEDAPTPDLPTVHRLDKPWRVEELGGALRRALDARPGDDGIPGD